MEEMVEDTLNMEEDDEIEEEADVEVDKVLFELTDGKLGEAGAAGTELPVTFKLFSPSETVLTKESYSHCKTSRTRKRRGQWRSIDSS